MALQHLLVLGLFTPASAQQPSIHYVYDQQNRLVGVVDHEGSVAVYVYDSVGNLLRIDRVDATAIPGALAITFATPSRGQVGTSVQVFGKGFSATPSANTVRFNGTPASVTEAASNRLVTAVPTGATTGFITVTMGTDTASSPSPFTVGSALAVDPPTGMVWVNSTLQFEATENGTPTAAVTWAVNGITGGDTMVGTISPAGLYTAPARVPSDTTVTIAATHLDDRSSSATATVTVRPGTAATTTVSVSATFASANTVNQNLTASVSAARAETATLLAGHVSAARAESPVTLLRGPGVSSSVAPAITSVTPTSAARGSTNITMTLTGTGLADPTGLTFLTKVGASFSADPNITVTDLSALADGTQATVTISVGSSAALGGHVVQIEVGGVTSTRDGTGANVFTVNP